MESADEYDPGPLSRILWELPRRKLVLLLLVVGVNVGVVVFLRGRQIGHDRWMFQQWLQQGQIIFHGDDPRPFVPPWDWSADEWRDTWPSNRVSVTRIVDPGAASVGSGE